jgi:copper homeostasis protein (lipoprotein)
MRNFKASAAAALVSLTAVGLAACQEGKVAPPVTSADDPVAPAVSVKKVVAVYEGVLPCADCQGIRTELTLFEDDSTYKLVETYLGTPDGDRTVESEGTWALRRPTFKDPEASIYQLHPAGKPGEVRNFLIVDERQIRQLDAAGREIGSRLEYTLTRKNPPATSN